MSVAVQPSLTKDKILYYPGPSYFVGRMTYEEYLAFEQDAEERHELIDGKVYLMPGGTLQHNRICFDTGRALADSLEVSGVKGEEFGNGQKVYVNAKTALYPDVSVIIGETADDQYSVRNPAVIVEVLSPSTAGYDRGEKFEKYQTLSSLRHYILIEQRRGDAFRENRGQSLGDCRHP